MEEAEAALGRELGFELVREVGRGATSRVYEARAQGETVALKVLATDDAGLRARFAREGRLATRLRHPNLVRAFRVIDHPVAPAIVLELVRAPSLAAVGPIREVEALRVLAEIGDALAHAHAARILHRDVKPANVLMDPAALRLCDLGLARPVDGTVLTEGDPMIGTLAYLAPEAVEGAASAAGDVYALGATVYHALAGRPPHVAPSILALVHEVTCAAPVAIRRLRPELSRGFAGLLGATLEKSPGARPDAVALGREARRLLG